jgi:dinuclear metal center YbgI/SA1388 family protein
MKRDEIVQFLDALLLKESTCHDDSNNGLQVEGNDEVERIAFAVDGCLEVFQQAVDAEADFLVVHHGISWGNGFRTLTGNTADRLRTLFCNGISLYGVHLPLDAHPEVGNNAVLARVFDLQDIHPFGQYGGIPIGFQGTLPERLGLDAFAQLVGERLATTPLVLDVGGETVERIGIISGGGASLIPEAAQAGLDCLLTGEITHQHVHTARECRINVVAGGHYQTEIWGVKSVMKWMSDTFPDLELVFLDVPTGF